MHPFRTHTCGELREDHAGDEVRLSGWIHRKRDHGNLLFVDLRDQYGITQCVIDTSSPIFGAVEDARLESVITVTGPVVKRSDETVNASIPTGHVEVQIAAVNVENPAEMLPLQVNSDEGTGEEIRLRYRFLDLRREKVARNILLRNDVIASIRRRMIEQGFKEFQTPILTASSPEGARDYLVPSRLHPGKFYALPQAPQQFKQLLMVGGFDKYFQIAPCFRDEDARADRSPGEFYQLDFEMAFVTQDDVFNAIEPVIAGVFEEFAGFGRDAPWAVTPAPFPRIAYADAMLKYGSDKPDLRNPIEIADVAEVFAGSDFKIFAGLVEKGGTVRAIPAPGGAAQPRSWFDGTNDWARGEGAPGLGYIVFEGGEGKGPIAKFVAGERLAKLKALTGLGDGDAVFFSAGDPGDAAELAGKARTKIGTDLGLVATTSAGSSTTRCTNATRTPARSSSRTTRSRCPRAGSRRWRARTRSTCWPGSTISCATGWSCRRARSGTTVPTSCSRHSRSPAMTARRSSASSRACSTPSATARRPMVAQPRASTGSSC